MQQAKKTTELAGKTCELAKTGTKLTRRGQAWLTGLTHLGCTNSTNSGQLKLNELDLG